MYGAAVHIKGSNTHKGARDDVVPLRRAPFFDVLDQERFTATSFAGQEKVCASLEVLKGYLLRGC